MGITNKITTQEKKDFVKTWALLIKTGNPINETLEILSKQIRSPIFKETLKKAKERTEKGTPIHQVFEENPHFEKAFASFIRAGEESGSLSKTLQHLIDWLERKNNLEKDISSATLYPKIIIIFAFLLGGGLTFFVLPKLTPIFASLGINLPLVSRILLSSSQFIQNNGVVVVIGFLFFILFIYLLSKIKKIRDSFDYFVLKIPVVGELVSLYQLTIISQLISTLFESGLMVTEIIDITIESTSNKAYKDSLEEVKEKIIKGDPFSRALSVYPDLYPSIYISIITTGEETGSFTESFKYLADFFSSAITEKTKKIPVVLEPIILIFIGLFVAFVASAIILPIYQVTQGLY